MVKYIFCYLIYASYLFNPDNGIDHIQDICLYEKVQSFHGDWWNKPQQQPRQMMRKVEHYMKQINNVFWLKSMIHQIHNIRGFSSRKDSCNDSTKIISYALLFWRGEKKSFYKVTINQRFSIED